MIQNVEQWLGQGHHPGNRGQQNQPHTQGQNQADDTACITLFRGQFFRQNGNKNQVVDTQYNF